MKKISLELLAPAKNLKSGKLAIDAGADAVYIGAPKFGARVAVGNSLEDISELVRYAHFFGVKVYLTLNTILFDNELEEVRKLIWDVYKIGVDAVIIQDMGILELDLPPIPLHASTQTNNYTIAKVKFLEDVGFDRVILARECSLEKMKEMRAQTKVDLEAFVHGSLCVCFSGQCYFSEAMTGRSANRGACSQPCRMPYNLEDSEGNIIEKNKHLLSLKDLNLSEQIDEMILVGITSFKIEGRLKDEDYVINVVAKYRQILDKIIAQDKKYTRASEGVQMYNFEPNLYKTFNRGYTTYFLNDRQNNIFSPFTPKSIGEKMGRVVRVGKNYFELDKNNDWAAGDGLCFFDDNNELVGTNVNRVEGKKIFPHEMKTEIFDKEIHRNYSIVFDRLIKSGKAVERKILVDFLLKENDGGFILEAKTDSGLVETIEIKSDKVVAQKPNLALESVKKQLSKLGETKFVARDIRCDWSQPYFLSLSLLNQLRRDVIEKLIKTIEKSYIRSEKQIQPNNIKYLEKNLDYRANISNELAKKFYLRHGVEEVDLAFELEKSKDVILMTTKHCLRYSVGMCPKDKNNNRKNGKEPKYLVGGNNRYQLEFDCQHCEMNIKKNTTN